MELPELFSRRASIDPLSSASENPARLFNSLHDNWAAFWRSRSIPFVDFPRDLPHQLDVLTDAFEDPGTNL